jgi:hypothetical protein
MIGKRWGTLAALVGALLLVGCGGGQSGSKDKAVTRARVIATTRVSRHTFAITGFARRITRSPRIGMGNRARLILSALHRSRSVEFGQDQDLGLYYVLVVNDDGSGHEDLFTEAAHQTPAGSFLWIIPEWTNGQAGVYPVTIRTLFQITKGDYAGSNGTLDATFDDPTGNNGRMHIVLHDAQGDTNVADFDVVDGRVTAACKVTLEDNSTYTEQDSTQDNGDIVAQILFPDGSSESQDYSSNGSGTETFTDPNGTQEATGAIQANGTDNISYDDGSSETVNVDTGTNTSTDASGNSDGGASKQASVRKVHR